MFDATENTWDNGSIARSVANWTDEKNVASPGWTDGWNNDWNSNDAAIRGNHARVPPQDRLNNNQRFKLHPNNNGTNSKRNGYNR